MGQRTVVSEEYDCGTGGLGQDPGAVERIEAPSHGPDEPIVAPHSEGMFDEMHTHLLRDDQPTTDREAGTNTLRLTVRRARQIGDQELEFMSERLLERRLIRKPLEEADRKLLEDTAFEVHARQRLAINITVVVERLHWATMREFVRCAEEGIECSFADALRAAANNI